MSSSIGMMTFPTEWENNPNVPVTTNQMFLDSKCHLPWACSSTPKKIGKMTHFAGAPLTFAPPIGYHLATDTIQIAPTRAATAGNPCLARKAPATSVHLALQSPHSGHSTGSVRCSRGLVDARTSGHGGEQLPTSDRFQIDKLVAESQAAISPIRNTMKI